MIEFQGIGTHWWIGSNKEISSDLEQKIITKVRKFEKIYSRFDKDSEISKLNMDKSYIFPNREIYDVLKIGVDLHKKTRGLFSPLVGTYLNKYGYDDQYSFEYQDSSVDKLKIKEFSKDRIEISENVYFDIGGYGKGLLVDRISNLLIEEGLSKFFVNAGGDIRVIGYSNKPKKFYLENPKLDSSSIGEILLSQGSLASSSINRRNWTTSQGSFNHIINPLSGESSQELIASYVHAENTLTADVISTLLLINPTIDFSNLFPGETIEYCIINKDYKAHKTEGYQGVLYT